MVKYIMNDDGTNIPIIESGDGLFTMFLAWLTQKGNRMKREQEEVLDRPLYKMHCKAGCEFDKQFYFVDEYQRGDRCENGHVLKIMRKKKRAKKSR